MCISESVDYMRVSEVVCFAPSDDSMTLTVPILADDIFESASGEMFLLRLKPVAANNTVQVDIIDSAATVTIFEDPSMCCKSIRSSHDCFRVCTHLIMW